jgi:GNAT superfamily N-acetyltransferase
MTSADIPCAMQLVAQARWNQLPCDWERFLALQPEGCFVAELAGKVVGTTTTCVFYPIAWIAMVLVEEGLRGRGIGTALVEHALQFIDAQGVRSIRLDATHLGQPIYERFGFVPQYWLTRFAGRLPQTPNETGRGVSPASPVDYRRLAAFDKEVTQTDRGKFLWRLFIENPPSVRLVQRDQRLQGWITVRHGREAWQLGPCLADATAGEELLADAAAQLSGEHVFFDAPEANMYAVRWAASRRLSQLRRFVRMCRGEGISDDVGRLWASSGPELG